MLTSQLDQFIILTVCDGDMTMQHAEYFRSFYSVEQMNDIYNMTLRKLDEIHGS